MANLNSFLHRRKIDKSLAQRSRIYFHHNTKQVQENAFLFFFFLRLNTLTDLLLPQQRIFTATTEFVDFLFATGPPTDYVICFADNACRECCERPVADAGEASEAMHRDVV
jgi:hypothetical protein